VSLTASNSLGSSTKSQTVVVFDGGGTAGESLFIAASAHAAGSGGTFFVTDARVFNPGSSPVNVGIYHTPKDADGATARISRGDTIGAGETRSYSDILLSTFGLSSAVGSLEIRPLDGNVLATSRTYNAAPAGTFGQFIAGQPASKGVGVGTTLHLLQVGKSIHFRANVGFCEVSGSQATVTVEMWDANGTRLGGQDFPLSTYGMKQITDIFGTLGVSERPSVRVTLRVTAGGGKILGYASVVDNDSTDQIYVAAQPTPTSGETLMIAAGASAGGSSNSVWKTDIRVANVAASSRTVKISLLPNGADNSSPQYLTWPLSAGQILSLDDAVASAFGKSGSAGFRIETDPAGQDGILATSRTYNQSANGTFGQFIPALPISEAIGAGDGKATVLQVDRSNEFRANVGFVNASGSTGKARVALISGIGAPLASNDYDLKPWSPFQINDIFGSFGVPWQTNARVDFEILSGSPKLLGYASVIDNRTNDPIYVTARKWPTSTTGQADLAPTTPSGWSGPIVISTVTGTNTDGSPVGNQTAYVDVAIKNQGTVAAGAFTVALMIDGGTNKTWSVSSLAAGTAWTQTDYSITLTPGSHTLTLVADSTSAVNESDETNNQSSKTMTWSSPGQPDLVPVTPSGWSGPIVVSTVTGTNTDGSPVGNQPVYVDLAVKNQGTAPAGPFYVALQVNGVTNQTFNVSGLAAGATWTQTDFAMTQPAGTRTLGIVADSSLAIAESNESNNQATKSVTWSTGTTTIVSDGFEGALEYSSGGKWDTGTYQGYSPNFVWARTTCDQNSGSYSADALRGGSGGSSLSCTATYPQGVGTYLEVHGGFNIQGKSAPRLRFKVRGRTNPATTSAGNWQDFLGVYIGSTYENAQGYGWKGDYSAAWFPADFDLKAWPTLGDLRNYSKLYIWFDFVSTSMAPSGYGFRIDDFEIVDAGSSAEMDPPAGSALPSGVIEITRPSDLTRVKTTE
jgi:hypothetical protein